MSTVCAQHWDAAVELDQYSKEEIIFWRIYRLLSDDIVF